MPISTTTQHFTCGHTHTTPNPPSSAPPSSLTSSLPPSPSTPLTSPVPMPARCLYCVCDALLTASTSPTSPNILPRADLRELEQHISMLKPVVNPVMRRELEVLEKQMSRLEDLDDIWFDLLGLLACAADM